MGGGSVIRDSNRKVVATYVANLGTQSSNMAEMMVAFINIYITKDKGRRLIIEGESKNVIMMVQGTCISSW